MANDDAVKDAAREIARAERAVAAGLKKRDRPQGLQPHEMAAVLAERRRREGKGGYGRGLDFDPAD